MPLILYWFVFTKIKNSYESTFWNLGYCKVWCILEGSNECCTFFHSTINECATFQWNISKSKGMEIKKCYRRKMNVGYVCWGEQSRQ